ncbi:MAG: hypothetical protein U0U09_18690 [Cyclobacteriaceae bacterium]
MKRTKAFTEVWWKKFLEHSGDLTKTTLWKDVLGDDRIKLAEYSDEVLRIAITENASDSIFRFWLNGKSVSEKSELIPLMEGNQKPAVEAMLSNASVDTIGLILNFCENLHEEFKRFIGQRVRPLLKAHGMPTHGIEISLFAGNYSKTPIGFHLDQRGHRVIHLQVGPGVKEMFLIPKHVFEVDLFPITKGEKSFHDVEALIPYAQKYVIEPGDVYFMPHGFYHVGRNLGNSTSITIWLENMQAEGLAEKLVLPIARRIFSGEGLNLVQNDKSSANSTSFFLHSLKEMVGGKRILDWTVEDLIRDAIQDYKFRLHSNNFFVPGYPIKFKSTDVLTSSKIQWQGDYELFTKKNGELRDFYHRGHKFSFYENPAYSKAISEMSKGKPVAVKKILKLFSSHWEDEVTLEFLKEFVKRDIIAVVR